MMSAASPARTSLEIWTVKKLLNAIREKVIKLPAYQRRGAWSESRQKELIQSLQRDWPIGSFLLAESPKTSGSDYLLIDGQQRATAINKFHVNPCGYLVSTDVNESVLNGCRELIPKAMGRARGDDSDALIGSAISSWLGKREGMSSEQGFVATELADCIASKLGGKATVDLVRQAEAVVSDLSRMWDVQDRELFVLVFRGDIDLLPEIFERINTKGQRLNKFDIYSASWYSEGTDTIISNRKLKNLIELSYKKQEEEGMVFDQPFGSRPAMLVEYLFGLSKILTARFELLFGVSADDHQLEEVGFNIAATSHKLSIASRSMEGLNGAMKLTASRKGEIDPAAFESALMDACGITEGILKPILGARLNRSKHGDPPEILHNTSQMISMVCRVLVGKYNTDFKAVRREWAKERGILARTLPQCYLEDVLQGNWSGAAGNTLWDRVWAPGEGGVEPSGYYLQVRERRHWEVMLDSYHEKLKSQRRTKGRYIQKHHKVFLKYAVSRLLKAKQHLGKTFEIEHLYPVSLLERKIGVGGVGWPIDHVANLALFTRKLNREKSAKTLSEYVESLGPGRAKRLEEEGFNMLMCRPERVALGPRKQLRLSQYEAFLDERYQEMRKEVLACLLR
jgi:hypothetical protein